MTDLAGLVGVDGAALRELVGTLTAQRVTVATAESLTGGLLAALLTETPGSSAVVRGGLVVYATDLKHALAGVDQGLLDAHGPVHPQVAAELAEGAARTCGATIGLGLTGVAGPDRQHGVPVGVCYVALWRAGTATVVQPPVPAEAAATRALVRAAAVRAAVELLVDQAAAPR